MHSARRQETTLCADGHPKMRMHISIGIAALIIEGRPLYDDEYAITDSKQQSHLNDEHNLSSLPSPSSSSPSSSSSSSSSSSTSSSLNVTPQTLAYESRSYRYNNSKHRSPISPLSPPGTVSSASSATPTSAFASKQDSIQHLERLRQKLHQLRSSPSTSRDVVEQSIAVPADYVPLALNYMTNSERDPLLLQQSKEGKPIKPTAINSLHLLAASSLHRTPRSLNEHSGLLKTVESWTGNKFVLDKYSSPSTSSASGLSLASSSTSAAATITKPLLTIECKLAKLRAQESMKRRKSGQVLGPHCDLFMNKVGLIKGTCFPDNSFDSDSHVCNPRNEICFRWIQHYKHFMSVYTKGDPICIEVYLGPENHAILLEQWIIQQSHEPSRSSMNIQSLCTAIRSQLHFSQITAWSDVLRTVPPYDSSLTSNPRIKNASKLSFKPKLDVLYRIRAHDGTSCFTSPPIEHAFPETMISEQLSVKVLLRSLPRMKEIPKLYEFVKASSNLAHEVNNIQPMISDNEASYPCNEKGKHRCTFDEESPTDESMSHRDKQLMKYKKRLMRRDKKKRFEEPATMKAPKSTIANETSGRSTDMDALNGSTQPHQKCLYDQTINPNKPPLYSSISIDATPPISAPQLPMAVKCIETIATAGVGTSTNHFGTKTTSKSTQTAAIEMISVATQTDNGQIIFQNCDFCGIEMQYFCWNCDKKMFTESSESQQIPEKADLLLKAIQRTPSTKQQALYTAVKKARGRPMSTNENGDHRQASALPSTSFNSDTQGKCADRNTCDIDNTSNNKELDVSDCRSCCKRQKTVHNYFGDDDNSMNNENANDAAPLSPHCVNLIAPISPPAYSDHIDSKSNHSTIGNSKSYEDDNGFQLAKREMAETSGSYRRTMSESVVGTCHAADDTCNPTGIDMANGESMNILSNNELKLYRRAYSEDELICNCDDNRPKQAESSIANSPPWIAAKSPWIEAAASTISQLDLTADTIDHFKTPTSTENHGSRVPFSYQGHSKVADERHVDLTGKPLPKINLSALFTKSENNQSSMASSALQRVRHSTPGENVNRSSNDLDVDAELQKISQTSMPVFSLNNIFDFENLSPPLPLSPVAGIHVQKSNSAPTFQHSPPALSPRFLKSAAATKRRSRHLSDRSSERLSVGSDEHISDEEFHQYSFDSDNEYRPGISPTKATLRFFPKNYAFRKRALLGSFEESLLQRRFEPKFLVPGYKVLLGASGCYCTTQITIPAYTFFYELNSETLSTPYVCEVRMPPRKGYVIPRTGQVQATLLNPNGMVVRMFVVAYDFRDMPAMCQTFVRQRILSFDENANPGQNVDDLSASEQMKLLRYAIHLRFQTTRSGRLALHSDIRILISRRTDCDTAAAHAKGAIESPSELKTVTVVPENPKFSPR